MADALREQLQAALGAAYTLERELGGGGMSRVFVARDQALRRLVVVKALLPELASVVSVRRFEREVHAAATLQHPHVVPVICAGHTAGGEVPYYIMPFVQGETLRERMRRAPVRFAEAAELLADVAKALAAAHEAGLVHRDVKPDNILVSGGAAVVTDFGIAHAIHEARDDADARLTALGSSLGTPGYLAPEQAAGDAVDARTDVYSWGVVAYETVAGHHPFPRATTGRQLIVAHMAERPAPLAVAGGAPPWFRALVAACLEKDPGRRPADGRALVAAMEGAGASGPPSVVARAAAGMRWLFFGTP
jgi:serine/threonine-protein kinase